MKRKKPPRTDDPNLMAISSVNGKRGADGKLQTIVVARQSNKLARRAVRTHVLRDKSIVGKGLHAAREPQPRSLHPHEKRALRRAEMERRAQAQDAVMIGDESPQALVGRLRSLGATTAENTVLAVEPEPDKDE